MFLPLCSNLYLDASFAFHTNKILAQATNGHFLLILPCSSSRVYTAAWRPTSRLFSSDLFTIVVPPMGDRYLLDHFVVHRRFDSLPIVVIDFVGSISEGTVANWAKSALLFIRHCTNDSPRWSGLFMFLLLVALCISREGRARRSGRHCVRARNRQGEC